MVELLQKGTEADGLETEPLLKTRGYRKLAPIEN